MLLHYLKNKENKDKKIARFLYEATIKSSLNIINNKNLNIKKEFDSSFELTCILLISILIGTQKTSLDKNDSLRDTLVYLFIEDLDHSFRTLGVSDIKIGKYVKKYTKKFYFRIPLLEKIFQNEDINLFIKYMHRFKIIENINPDIFLISVYKDLYILIKRVKIMKNPDLIYENLFK